MALGESHIIIATIHIKSLIVTNHEYTINIINLIGYYTIHH